MQRSLLELTPNDYRLANEAGLLGAALLEFSQAQLVMANTPEMFSLSLFRRLESHYRGFTLLWNAGLSIEPAILLKAGIEAAICIAANYVLREKFVQLARDDLAATLSKGINMWRASGDADMEREWEAQRRALRGPQTKGSPRSFDWGDLAERGGVPWLYQQHRSLSSWSAHVTGVSLMRSMVGHDDAGLEKQIELQAVDRVNHLLGMISAMVIGCKLHADLFNATDCQMEANRLVDCLNARPCPAP